MLDRAEIEAAIARDDAEELRDVFDELVAWTPSGGIAGVADADALMDLFKRVCAAMQGDEARAPAETVRALARGRGTAGLCRTGTYDEAARLALAAHRTWWPAFAASFEVPGDG